MRGGTPSAASWRCSDDLARMGRGPALARLLLAALGAVIGGMVAPARLAHPWMREAARAASDDMRGEVKAEVRALAEKLATNDFPHVEARIERGLQDVGERIDRVEARIGERLDRARQDRKDMEVRIGERFDRMEAHLLAPAATSRVQTSGSSVFGRR